MPKKGKAKKNSKNNRNSIVEKRKLIEADLDSQVYGMIDRALGARFFSVNCTDNVNRRCRVRTKRMRIRAGDWVIISLRDFDDTNADIVYRYDSDEVRQLQKIKALPTTEIIDVNSENEDDNDVFEFEDI